MEQEKKDGKDNIKKLYDALSEEYHLGSEEEFRGAMNDPAKRGDLYKAAAEEYHFGSEEEFNRSLGYGGQEAPSARQQAGKSAQQVVDEYDRAAGTPERQQARELTEEEKARMSAGAASMQGRLAADMEQADSRIENLSKRAEDPFRASRLNIGTDARPVRLGENRNVQETGMEYDPTTGDFGRKYVTEAGNEYRSKAAADLEQGRIDDAKARELDPINTALRDAYAERDRLAELMAARKKEIDEEEKASKESMGGIGRFLREFTEASRMPRTIAHPMANYRTDEQYRQLEAAARKNHAAIQTLEDQRDGKMNGFWHSALATAGNGYTFTEGLSEINDAIALMDARERIDAINQKRSEGKPLTREEEAAEAVLRAEAANNAVQGAYGDYGAWARAGMMLPTSIDMMKDIMTTPYAGGIAKGVAGKIAGLGAKALAKEAGEAATKAASKAVARAVLKGTGIAVGAHTAGAVISNTGGLGHTVAEWGTNLAGETYVDEQGNIRNDGGMGFMEALAEAERNQIRENGSEMFGAFLPGVGGAVRKVVAKGMEKLGLSRLTGALQSIGNKDWYRQYSALLKSGGYNGLPGEALEEYEGMAFDALTGHAGETWEQLKDPRTHIDIWLGCATMGAFLGAVPMTVQGMHTAQYYRYRHATDVADKAAGYRMGQDKWEAMRDRIDQTPNESMADEVTAILNDGDMHTEEKRAALNYVRNLTKMRGFDIAQVTNSKEQSPDAQQANQSYSDGYNAQADEELQDIKNRYERNASIMTAGLGIDERELEDTDWIAAARREAADGTEDGRKRAGIMLDYVNSKQAYEGMIQRVRDDIDGRIAQSDAMVDRRVNHETGMVQGATLKAQDDEGNDRRVYVLSGDLATYEDGTGIDKEKSSGSIVVLDAETGKLEMVSPDAILSLDQPIDPETEKRAAAETIRQQLAQEAAARIDGTVAFNPGDTYTVTYGDGQTAQIQVVPNEEGIVDNGDGTVNVSSDGGQTVAPMRKDDIQAMVDATGRTRVEQAERQREAMRPQEQEGQPAGSAGGAVAEEPATYSLNDEVTLLDENGNEVRGSIVGDINEDGRYTVQTESPVNGRRVNLFTAEELDRLRADRPDDGQPPAGSAGAVVENITDESAGTQEEGYERKNVSGGSSDIGPEPVGMQNGTAPLQDTLSNGKDSENTANGQGNNVDDEYNAMIDRARDGDETARAWLREYGLDWGRQGVYRFAAKGEVDNILAGGQYNGRLDDGRVDATNSDTPTTAASAEYRITFKDGFDFNKKGTPEADRAVMKNAELGDGYVTGGYTLDDVARIERRNDDGSYEAVYDARQSATQEAQPRQGAMERIPKDAQGQPLYEQADSDTAWDAIVEQAGGDEAMAQSVVDSMVADKEAALKKAEKAKPKGGTTIAEKIAAEQERRNVVEQAKADLAQWQRIAQTSQRREQAAIAEQSRKAEEAARQRREQEEKERAAREEEERKEVEQNPTEAEYPEETGERVRLSDEVDENGRQFVLTSNGDLEFGKIETESGLTPAPILLSEGLITNPATNDGYGLVHIEARHGNQIRKAGYKSVLAFIEDVAQNYERIKEGKDRRGNQTYMLQLKDKHNNTLIVELSSDGNYWNINTAGIFKESYGKNRKEVYRRHTTAKQPAGTVEASQETEQGGTPVSSSMVNAPTTSQISTETSRPTNRTDVDSNLSGKSDDTATRQRTDVSADKGTEKSRNGNKSDGKVTQADEKAEWQPTETAAERPAADNTDVSPAQNKQDLSAEANELFSDQISKSVHNVEISDGNVSETGDTLYAPIRVDGKETNLSLFWTEPVHSSEEPIVGVAFYRDGLTYQEASDLSEEYNNHVGRKVCSDGSDELAINFGNIDEAVKFEKWLSNRESPDEDGTGANDGVDGTANETDRGRSGRNGGENKAGEEKEESTKGQLTKAEAAEIIADMEEHAEVAPEVELTIENWDALFGEDGRVNTPYSKT